MPVFGGTVQSVIRTSDSETSTVSQLAQVILQDTSMTARVLKMANSIYYNPSQQQISTVSRAIIILGFEVVRNICVTITLIDSMVTGFSRERVAREMALSVHAAIQARNIAEQRGDPSTEEVFIATLLYRIGQMAFWCFSKKEAEQLDGRLKEPDADPDKAEFEVLGFRLKDLTKSLAKEWHLNDLLQEALDSPRGGSPRIKNIALSHRLAKASEQGWDSKEVESVISEISEVLGQPVETVSGLVHEAAKDAVEIASSYGAATIAKIIPLPAEYASQVHIEDEDSAGKESFPEPDPMLQLDILREIKGLISERPTFNTLLEMVLEGIYRGIGMDRTLFALMSPDHKMLRAKYALGSNRERLMEDFAFPLSKQEPSIFLYAMAKRKPIRVQPEKDRELAGLITPQMEKLLGRGEFFVAPLVINNKAIGIIYADRLLSKRQIDERTLQGFEHFAAEANMGLDYIANRKPG
jgi:HD-like signal output (HDOD) protein